MRICASGRMHVQNDQYPQCTQWNNPVCVLKAILVYNSSDYAGMTNWLYVNSCECIVNAINNVTLQCGSDQAM